MGGGGELCTLSVGVVASCQHVMCQCHMKCHVHEEMSHKAAMAIHVCATTHKLPSEAANLQYGVYNYVSEEVYMR